MSDRREHAAGAADAVTAESTAVAASGAPSWLLVAGPMLLVLGAALLGLAVTPRGLAVLWPAAGVVTGILLLTPRHRLLPVVAGLALGLLVGNVLVGRSPALNLMFIVANIGEGWLVAWLLQKWSGTPVRLQRLRHVGQFAAAVAIAVTLGGAIGAAIMTRLPGVGSDFLDTWGTWIRARGVGMLTVTPAVLALASMRRPTLLRVWHEGKATLLALAGIIVATYVMTGADWLDDDLLALLLLLALVYPLVLTVAARSEPAWTHLALLLITIVVAWRIGHGGGIFRGSPGVAQSFLFVSSLWALTLGIVMEQQRIARRLAKASERNMRAALAAGRGFTFDWNPKSDRVVRVDPNLILAPFTSESGATFYARVLDEDRDRLLQLVGGLSSSRPMYETTYGSHRPDGKVVWLHERGVGEFDESGALARLQGLTMDVTERRAAEEALREADRSKDRFIATLAHELRNPLAPIRTAAELLGAAGAGPAEIGWSREVIQRQVGHMAALLDDLLDVARITRGKLELRRQWVRLVSIVESAVEVASPLIDARRTRLSIDLPVPAPMLDADPLRLGQVISNLLSNAAKYTDPEGHVALEARVRGNFVDIVVRDDGIGIPPESLGSIFQMFSQVESASGRSLGGLGIGLSLVKGVVELHGGTVHAHSAGPGQGSEFVVTLPCVPTASAPSAQSRGGIDAPLERTGTRRILAVDDNRDAADSLALLLRLEGHEVQVAYGGQQAIEAAREFAPDVAILDLGLPDLSGYDVAQRLRSDPSLAHVTLIALTGWGQEEHRRRALEAGFDHHLTKPVDLGHLGPLLDGNRGKH